MQLTTNNFGVDACKEQNLWLRGVLVKLCLESYSTVVKQTHTHINAPATISFCVTNKDNIIAGFEQQTRKYTIQKIQNQLMVTQK